jgi:hypothetical protein
LGERLGGIARALFAVPRDNLDQDWLIAIDNFERLRGETAHMSGVGVTHLIDPKTEADL